MEHIAIKSWDRLKNIDFLDASINEYRSFLLDYEWKLRCLGTSFLSRSFGSFVTNRSLSQVNLGRQTKNMLVSLTNSQRFSSLPSINVHYQKQSLLIKAFPPSPNSLPREMLTNREVPAEQTAKGKKHDETWPLDIQPLTISLVRFRQPSTYSPEFAIFWLSVCTD